MGHELVLVIGDDSRDQLGKYQRTEYAEALSKYIVTKDILAQAKQRHFKWDELSFVNWAKMYYAITFLADGQVPDLRGIHRNGWMLNTGW